MAAYLMNSRMATKPKYKRVLLKLSGEALMGDRGFGLDLATLERIADDVRSIKKSDIEICIVIGGGNIFRGVSGVADGLERASADYMGMLATIINALGMQSVLEKFDVDTRVLSALPMTAVSEPYIRRRALRHMEKGRVVIFAAGTGNPFFTTDTAAALRAAEMNCDVLMKGTQVEGVYDKDPAKFKNVKHFKTMSYEDILVQDIKIMDASAISLARENDIPIIVFSIHSKGSLINAVSGRGKFTVIKKGGG